MPYRNVATTSSSLDGELLLHLHTRNYIRRTSSIHHHWLYRNHGCSRPCAGWPSCLHSLRRHRCPASVLPLCSLHGTDTGITITINLTHCHPFSAYDILKQNRCSLSTCHLLFAPASSPMAPVQLPRPPRRQKKTPAAAAAVQTPP